MSDHHIIEEGEQEAAALERQTPLEAGAFALRYFADYFDDIAETAKLDPFFAHPTLSLICSVLEFSRKSFETPLYAW